jgi:anti-anti-sigma factor
MEMRKGLPPDVAVATRQRGELSRFTCEWSESGLGAAWIRVTGELDLATAPRLERTLRAATSRAQLVVLDLRRLEFMDASGAHVIAESTTSAQDHGRRLIVLRGPAHVDALFTLTPAGDQVEVLELHGAQPPVQVLLQLAATARNAPSPSASFAPEPLGQPR